MATTGPGSVLAAILLGVVGCAPVVALPPAASPVMGAASLDGVARQIRADNERRQAANPDGYARKLARLAEHPFAFLRGTTPQFYRRLFAAMPPALRQAPETIVHGDLHLENFAVVPTAGGLTYGIDDFDEALPGPISLDLVRCMTSLTLAFGDDPALLEDYLAGYRQGLSGQGRLASQAVAKVLDKAKRADQAKMLAKRTIATRPRQMKPTEATIGLDPAHKRGLQAAVAAARLPGLDGLPFQDAVQRFGGTASLDLFRYEAVYGDGGDRDQIVEIKELLPSVLSRHLGGNGDDLARYRRAQAQYQGPQALPVAATRLGPYQFLVRYRPAFKDSVTADDVKPSDRRAFVMDLGRISGAAHARGNQQPSALDQFVSGQGPAMIDLALSMARQNHADFQAFRSGG